MRRFFAFLVVFMLSGCGMFCPFKSTGWEWRVYNPPTVSAPAIVAQGTAPVGVAAITAYPASPGAAPVMASRLPGPCDPCPPSTSSGPTLAAGNPCVLEDVCRRLDAMERNLNAQKPLPKPMPVGPMNPAQ
jgi:hypothetical protein